MYSPPDSAAVTIHVAFRSFFSGAWAAPTWTTCFVNLPSHRSKRRIGASAGMECGQGVVLEMVVFPTSLSPHVSFSFSVSLSISVSLSFSVSCILGRRAGGRAPQGVGGGVSGRDGRKVRRRESWAARGCGSARFTVVNRMRIECHRPSCLQLFEGCFERGMEKGFVSAKGVHDVEGWGWVTILDIPSRIPEGNAT